MADGFSPLADIITVLMIILIIGTALALSGFLAYIYKKLLYDLHMMQLNSYMNTRWSRWFKTQKGKRLKKRDFLTLIAPLLLLITGRQGVLSFTLAMFIAAMVYWLLFFTYRKQKEKKPLVMTPRAKRLFIKAYSINIFLVLILVLSIILNSGTVTVLLMLLLALSVIFSYLSMLLANIIMQPYERAVNRNFFLSAQDIIKGLPGLITVGITGSYGKTSSKLILEQILSEKYLTLATPESYNTPMGVTRVIRETLRPIHEVFIAEMGAKKPGDIKELCDLVNPQIGILTAVGEQHLETFGSFQAVIDTKFELIEALPEDGMAVLNFDDPNIKANAGRGKCRVISYAIDNAADYYATDISYSSHGTAFTVHTPDGEAAVCQSLLLGRHNIYNLLAAIALAHQLGMELPVIKKAVGHIQPVTHRLQLLKNPQGFNIIDDAFNSNPVGAEMALEVLASFPEGKKILLTPGMVELGEREYQLNKEFAIKAASKCDYIILVGEKHSKPLQDGLEEAACSASRYHVAKNLTAAWQHLQTIVQKGDTVLLENDLPDTYNE